MVIDVNYIYVVITSQYIQILNHQFLKKHRHGYLPRVYIPAGSSLYSACVLGSHLLTGRSPGIFSLQFLVYLLAWPGFLLIPVTSQVSDMLPEKALYPEALHILHRHCPFIQNLHLSQRPCLKGFQKQITHTYTHRQWNTIQP